MKRNLIIFVVALPFIISFAFLIATKRPAPVPDPPLPNPNGYDKFVAAGGMLIGDAEKYDTMSESELAALVATNTKALALARSALTNDCRVSTPYFYDPNTVHLDNFRHLAEVMTAKGRLAELEHDPARAAKDYLDVVHYGTEAGRGGFTIDVLIGIAIEGMGYNHLTNLIDNLDAASYRDAASAVEYFDSRRQDWNDAVEMENNNQSRLHPGLKHRFWVWFWTHKENSESLERSKAFFFSQQSKTRKLAIQFAARAYELDKGKPPTSITDLVPTYLKAIPQDPTTGKNMVYPP